MKRGEIFYGGVIFGQRFPEFGRKDYEVTEKIKKLALKYYNLCVKFDNENIPYGYFEQEKDKIMHKVHHLISSIDNHMHYETKYYNTGFVLLYKGYAFPFELI